MSLIEPFLHALRDSDATALHLRGGVAPGWRVGGQVLRSGDPLPPPAEFDAILLDLAAEVGRGEDFRAHREFEFALECDGARFRVHMSRTSEGRHAVIRRASDHTVAAAQLGIPESLREATRARSGLVLVSGPAGSGRATTVAALLDAINRDASRYIVSVEDAGAHTFEPRRSLVHRIRVGEHAPDFPTGIATALSARANVIAIGTVDDTASATLAVRGAESGSLVIAVLPAFGVADALGRMLDLLPVPEHGYYRSALAENLRFVAFQRLLPRVQGGVVPAFEYATGTVEVAALVRANRLPDLVPLMEERSHGSPHRSLDRGLETLVKTGRVARDVALRVARDARRIDRASAPADV